MSEISRGCIETVLGPIKPEQLGVTLCHEHLYHKSYCKTFVPNPKPHKHCQLSSTDVCPENLWYTSYYPYSQEDNLDFTSSKMEAIICDEMKFLKSNGGDSVVEVTTFGKDFQALSKMSKESGVNIIANTGFYIKGAFQDDITSLSVEALYNIMKSELVTGVNGIKAGVIGELGCSWPLNQFEKNVLIAAAQIQSELHVPVIIHPGRNKEAPFEIIRVFTEAGGVVSKTVMSHLERTLTIEQMLEFAKMGAICELDLFGTEVSYYQLSDDFDMPNDATRIAEVKQLVDEGYGDMVTISHDIHTKHRLMRYGGHGFSHILLNVVPKMLKRGITSEQIDQILKGTPKRWLTL